MKHASGLVPIALVLLPVPAAAQSATATGTVAVGGQVAPLCIIGQPNPPTVNLGALANSSGARVGRVVSFSPQTVTLPASFCNFAGSQLTVQATALLSADSASPPSGFSRAVNYTATASGWATTNAVAVTAALNDGVNATAVGTGSTQPLPRIADLSVVLSNFTAPGDAILVAGAYSGTIIVTLGPAAAP